MSKLIPHKKKKVKNSAEILLSNPLPIAIKDCGNKDIPDGKIRAVFENNRVLVKGEAEIRRLRNNGFFGDFEELAKLAEIVEFEPDLRFLPETKEKDGEKRKRKNFDGFPLILNKYEVIFLAHFLDCLRVENHSAGDLWTKFSLEDGRFPFLFRCYHHFRCQKWIVRDGIKFGADFLLYPPGGPELFHASCSVSVRINGNSFSWKELSGLNRVTEAAGKELIIAETESDLQADALSNSVENLSGISLKETLVKRFLPSEQK